MVPYKHWWAFHPTEARYAGAWLNILQDSIRIIAYAHATHGIAVHGPGGYGQPILSRRNGIHLGGDVSASLHRQPLLLPAPDRDPHPSPCGTPAAARGSADTGRHPYDTVVAAILLRCHLLLGHDFSIRSDGDWNREWAHGCAAGVPGPRALLADLLGPIPDTSPLTWPPQPNRAHPEGSNHA